MNRAVVNVLIAATLFGAVGAVISASTAKSTAPLGWVEVPAPHTIPIVAGGTSLRLAMVHDVLHQRYLTHSPAWAAAVESKSRLAVQAGAGQPPTDALLGAFDDLGAALDRQGRAAEAVQVLRDKLPLVEALHGAPPAPIEAEGKPYDALAVDDPPRERRFRRVATRDLTPAELAWYRTWANLGTYLAHAAFGKARAGDAAAAAALAEGEGLILRALELNPGAHFGRETWQAVLLASLRRAIENPRLLASRTVAGDLLGEEPGPLAERRKLRVHVVPLHRYPGLRRNPKVERWTAEALPPELRTEAAGLVWRAREDFVTRTGEGLRSITPLVAGPVPFDEPTLAYLGIWTLGSGPNPHLALALGEILLRVGQAPLAWSAYARTKTLAKGFWPDPARQAALVAHCDARQALLEDELGVPRADLQAAFERELALGQALQAAQAEHEAAALAAGVDPADPALLAPFVARWEAEHGPIASPVGSADLVAIRATRGQDVLSAALFLAGVGAVLGLFLRSSRRS